MMHLLSDILEREESGCFEQDSVIFSLDVAVRIRDSHRLSIKQPFLVLLFLFLMEIFISSVAYRVVFTRFSAEVREVPMGQGPLRIVIPLVEDVI